MPDAERAMFLARLSACAIIALLYALGGLSLYLRSQYLKPTAQPLETDQPTPTSVIQLVATSPVIAPSPTSVPTATLYPTITPKPAAALGGNDQHRIAQLAWASP